MILANDYGLLYESNMLLILLILDLCNITSKDVKFLIFIVKFLSTGIWSLSGACFIKVLTPSLASSKWNFVTNSYLFVLNYKLTVCWYSGIVSTGI